MTARRRSLEIGKSADGARPFRLPLELATLTSATVGVRGSGKTVTETVIVEELLKLGIPVVIIDPTDVWFGLKSSGDGRSAGFPVVVLGGPRGDLPLSADSGAAIADFVVEHPVPMILSLRHLRKGKQRQFVTDFAEQLYHRKGEPEHRTPLRVVFDEASQFIPQRVMGDSARMVGAVQDLVRLGRSAGLGVGLVDQRPASVNKDVLTQLEVLVAHRITSPQDRKALLEWIQQHDSEGHRDTFLESLASLPTGEAWFWAPVLDVFDRVQVRMRETFDSSKTPELGEAPPIPEKVAEVDLDALRSQMEETLAEAQASDPKVLRRRIAELEAELRRTRAAAGPDPAEVRERIDAAVAAARAETLRRIRAGIGGVIGRIRHLGEAARAIDDDLDSLQASVDLEVEDAERRPPPAPRRTAATQPRATRRKAPAAAPPPSTNGDRQAAESVSRPQQRILDVLASLEAIGLDAPERSTVAVFADQSPRSSGYANNLGSLRSSGLIDYPAGGRVQLTSTGRSIADSGVPVTTLAELHDAWLSRVSGPQRRILEELIQIYPADIERTELAELTEQSPTSSGYANNLGFLRNSLGLIDYPSSGRVAATALLFPEGLR